MSELKKINGPVNIVGELEATSLDINGAADISGTLTVGTTITTPANTNLFVLPNGSGHVYFGNSGNGMKLYHYSSANDGIYTTYDFNGNYYRLSTSATSGVWINDPLRVGGALDIDGDADISGALTLGTALAVAEGGTGATNLNALVQTSGNQTIAGVKQFSDYINAAANIHMAGHLYNTNDTYSIDLNDHSGYTWFRNPQNRWVFQGGASGDDWTQSFHFNLETVGTGFNDKVLRIGQQQNNGSSGGKYKGVRIVKSTGSSSVVDGYLQAGDAVFSGDITVSGEVEGGSLDINGNAAIDGLTTLTSSVHPLIVNRTGGSTALIQFKINGTSEGYLGATSTKSFVVYNETPAERFSVSNAGVVTATNDVIAFSDRKLKENIQTLDGKKVLDMRGVSFTRKDTGEESSGVIAQEIQKVAPELVHDTEGTLGVAYGNLVGYLIEAIKDQQKQIDELKAMINGNS